MANTKTKFSILIFIILSLLISAFMFIGQPLKASAAEGEPAAGMGTELEPYIVATEAELTEALAAGDAVYIKLGANIAIANTYTIENGKTVHLDLSGFTLDIASYTIRNFGTLEVLDSGSNGSIIGSNRYMIYNVGFFTLTSGTVSNESEGNYTDYRPLFNNTSAVAVINGGTLSGPDIGINNYGTLTINAGTVIGKNNYGIDNYPDGTLVIRGGEVIGSICGISNQGDVEMTGGALSGGIQNFSGTLLDCLVPGYLYYNENSEVITLTEGQTALFDTFTVAPCQNHTFADGICSLCKYICTHDNINTQTGVCEVCNKQWTLGVIAGMEIEFFNSLPEAFAKAEEMSTQFNAESTVKLLANFTMSSSVTLGSGTIILDLNGFTLDCGSYYITNNATLELRGEAGGEITGTCYKYVIENYGSLTLTSGTVSNTNSEPFIDMDAGIYGADSTVIYNDSDSEVIINGGTVNGAKDGIDNYGSLTINGGAVITTSYAIKNRETLTVNGGEIRGGDGIENGGDIRITGGVIEVRSEGIINYGGNIEMTGGWIDGQVGIYISGGNASVSGGTLDGTPYGIHIGYDGTATLSGGTFGYFLIDNDDLTIADCLAPGYLYYYYEDGSVVTVAEGSKQMLFTFTVAPCQNHTGGTATCTTLAVCDTCKDEYGTYYHPDADTNGFCDECGKLHITEATFPDANFRTYITENFDTDKDGLLSPDKITAVTSINVHGKGISDLSGIEYFTELTELDLTNNNLTSIDISALSELTILSVYNNTKLASLNLSGNPALEQLNISFCTSLRSLNLSNNINLMSLEATGCVLTSLDLSHSGASLQYGSESSTYIEHCGIGYVNMNLLGDVTRMEITSGGKMGSDGWLLLDPNAADDYGYIWIRYNYDTKNGYDELPVRIRVNHDDFSHTYVAHTISKDETHHYTQWCEICHTGNEEAVVAEHIYQDGICTDCAYACVHDVNAATGICALCAYQFELAVEIDGKLYFFNQFEDALAKAEESTAATPATIKLYSGVTAYSAVTLKGGVVTLDLCGHELSFFYTTVMGTRWTVDGATVTIKDSSAEKTGVIQNVTGYNNDGIALINGAFLIFESGTIQLDRTKAFSVGGGCTLHQKGGTVTEPIKLAGGTYILEAGSINTVEKDGSAGESSIVLRGGTIENGLVLDSGIASAAAVGFAFYDADGNIIILTDGQTELSGKVEVKPCPHDRGFELATNEDYHWVACVICGYDQNAEGHTYASKNSDDAYLISRATCVDEAVYYLSCACGRSSNNPALTFEGRDYDPENHTGTNDKLSNNYNGSHDIIRSCCEERVEEAVVCTVNNPDSDCTTDDVCACGYVINYGNSRHTLIAAEDSADEIGHIEKCSNEGCTYEIEVEHKIHNNDGICTTDDFCICGYKMVRALADHSFTDSYCTSEGCYAYLGYEGMVFDKKIEFIDHVFYVNGNRAEFSSGYLLLDGGNHYLGCDIDLNNFKIVFSENAMLSLNGHTLNLTAVHIDSKSVTLINTEGNGGISFNVDNTYGIDVPTSARLKLVGNVLDGKIVIEDDGDSSGKIHFESFTGKAQIITSNIYRDMPVAICNEATDISGISTSDANWGVKRANDGETLVLEHLAHEGGEANCTERAVCDVCGGEYGDYYHSGEASKLSANGNGTHNILYTCCDSPTTENISCAPKDTDESCLTAEVCICDYVIKAAKDEHDFSGEYLSDKEGHWHKCEDCSATDTKGNHAGGFATCTAKAACTACGTAYGELDSNNHSKTTFIYTENANGGTHTKKYECCGVVALDSEAHTYGADNKCACGAEKPVPTYTVTVENGRADNGNTSIVVNENGTVTVTANAAPEGKKFKGWSINGRVVSTEQSYTFSIAEDTTITAVYENIGNENPEPEAQSGLPAGAIAAIALASAAALAGGGFAIWWFVFKKKKA